MVEPAVMQQVFVRLGFDVPTSTAITDTQGISNVHEMRLLKDEMVDVKYIYLFLYKNIYI
jgi:hypothetical protein